jgi:hypothetical protein
VSSVWDGVTILVPLVDHVTNCTRALALGGEIADVATVKKISAHDVKPSIPY